MDATASTLRILNIPEETVRILKKMEYYQSTSLNHFHMIN